MDHGWDGMGWDGMALRVDFRTKVYDVIVIVIVTVGSSVQLSSVQVVRDLSVFGFRWIVDGFVSGRISFVSWV